MCKWFIGWGRGTKWFIGWGERGPSIIYKAKLLSNAFKFFVDAKIALLRQKLFKFFCINAYVYGCYKKNSLHNPLSKPLNPTLRGGWKATGGYH